LCFAADFLELQIFEIRAGLSSNKRTNDWYYYIKIDAHARFFMFQFVYPLSSSGGDF
jgi:hypothetical protein